MSSSGHDDDEPERLVRSPIGNGNDSGNGHGHGDRNGTTTVNSRRLKKKRVRNFTDDDRAAHRIFEKARREAFKEALANLASLLPALADTEPQRLSKHVVVDESITFIRSQHDQFRTVSEHLETLKTERDELLAELNHWRGGAGMEPRQANNISHSTMHHSDASDGAAEAIPGAVPTTLQHTESSMPMIGEAAPTFVTNSLQEPNPTPLSAGSNPSLHWEGFEPQMPAFANHVQGGEGSPTNSNNNINNADLTQLAAYPTPQSSNGMSQFNMDRDQHGVIFLPFESPRSFSHPGGFQTDTFVQNTAPLQDYIPP